MPNYLIHESSPYLLQHAHNPVNWLPWGEVALKKAKEEDKLMLISIGYSACHWCHVMEKENFENDAVANIMNEHFVCIKVDREELPNIDQVYMQAVQLMSGRGGWPLNCFTLPDGRPVYGGTYFPKEHWTKILINVNELYKNEKEKVLDYAERLTQGIRQSDLIKVNTEIPAFSKNDLEKMIGNWAKHFDVVEGGPDHSPKFPLPNNYEFLLRYGVLSQQKNIVDHVNLTLTKMVYGGIYDQIGGGFARYSTDELWKVPHFEKMLYDNAQLVSLYAEAFQVTQHPLYKQVVYETLEFIKRELTSSEGFFYSALDADSEGIEGKYYVWTKSELESLLGASFNLITDYYNINHEGYWEDGNYILLRKLNDEDICKKHEISLSALNKKVAEAKQILLQARSKRVKPGLDDKILTSWNALMIKAYIDAYNILGEKDFLNIAIKVSEGILQKIKRTDGGLWHSYKNGKASINGFLEDYCFMIEAFISIYQATFNEKWLHEAHALMQYVMEHFFDASSSLFYFTSNLDEALIARKKEIQDNVIPASNSSIAKSLFMLSHYFDEPNYNAIAIQMLHTIKNSMAAYGSAYSNWGNLLLNFVYPYYQIAIVGKEALEKKEELNKKYIPNKLLIGSEISSQLPLLKNKFVEDETLIYVCHNKTCNLPVKSIDQITLNI